MRNTLCLFLLFLSISFSFSQEIHREYVLSGFDGKKMHLSGKGAQAFDLEKEKKEVESISILNYHFAREHTNLLREITAQAIEIEFRDETGKSYQFLKSESQELDDLAAFSFSGAYGESPISMIYLYREDPLPYFVPYFMAWGECPDEYPDFMANASFELLFKDKKGRVLMKRSFLIEEKDWEQGTAQVRKLDIFLNT